jgi:glycerate-2-kinase
MTFAAENPRTLLRALFAAAVRAADPADAVARNLPEPPGGRTVVIGAGKASIAMAEALERNWPGRIEGFVVAPHGYSATLQRLEVMFGGHPVPDGGSLAAAERALALAATLGEGDLLIALMSGGGSALMAKPAPGIAFDDKLALNRALLRSGAGIAELNCVRKQVSAVKGGRLARAAGTARVVTLAVSDVPGDDPAVVASGPTVADRTTRKDAAAVLARYRVEVPPAVAAWLAAPEEPGTDAGGEVEARIIVSPAASFAAAAELARARGLNVLYLGDRIEGEAREVAKVHAAIAREIADHGQPVPRPAVLLSGGETSVTVRGRGRGGRNVEFLLGLALALGGDARIHALSADTDGVDGMEAVAGAVIGPDTLARAHHLGLDAAAYLAGNDAHSLFERLDDQVVTGPTHTNVNDFRAILIG